MSRPPAAAADSPVRVAAPAKVNLYLHVVGRRPDRGASFNARVTPIGVHSHDDSPARPDRGVSFNARGDSPARPDRGVSFNARGDSPARPDGYHLLDSLVAFADIGDTIEARAAPDLSLAIDGPFAGGIPEGNDNLVLRAAKALAELAGTREGAAIRLVKRLPPASGIGGGSADAAATLRALMRLWDARPDDRALARMALGLGADVPVCLAGRPAFVGGIGEDITFAPALPAASIVLANPGFPVATAEVFRRRAQPFSQPARFSETPRDAAELATWLKERGNDLEAPARTICPAIGDVIAALERQPGALIARMSGSGGTCFALFALPGPATEAAGAIQRARPGWWVKAGALESDATRLENRTAPE